MLATTRNRLPTLFRNPATVRFAPTLLDEMFNWPELGWTTEAPLADFYEKDDAFNVELDLPGFERENIDVMVEQGVLTITGERPMIEEEKVNFHLRERPFERFTRTFTLPRMIDAAKVESFLHNGVLKIILPKAPEAVAKKIAVAVK